MEYKNVAILDLTGCKYLGELHQRIKETLLFPDYYGENWDAFLDAFRTVGVPDKIVIKGESSIPKGLIPHLVGMHNTLAYMREELARLGQWFDYEIID